MPAMLKNVLWKVWSHPDAQSPKDTQRKKDQNLTSNNCSRRFHLHSNTCLWIQRALPESRFWLRRVGNLPLYKNNNHKTRHHKQLSLPPLLLSRFRAHPLLLGQIQISFFSLTEKTTVVAYKETKKIACAYSSLKIWSSYWKMKAAILQLNFRKSPRVMTRSIGRFHVHVITPSFFFYSSNKYFWQYKALE